MEDRKIPAQEDDEALASVPGAPLRCRLGLRYMVPATSVTHLP